MEIKYSLNTGNWHLKKSHKKIKSLGLLKKKRLHLTLPKSHNMNVQENGWKSKYSALKLQLEEKTQSGRKLNPRAEGNYSIRDLWKSLMNQNMSSIK